MRISPLSLLPIPLLLFSSCGGKGEAPPPRWNVLLVTLDTTRPDWLGCYGGRAATPNIDRVAQDGARFEHCQSTAGITPMSHASILTGLNNYNHGMRVFYSDEVSHQLKSSVDTLPEILGKRRGYATGASLSAYVVSEIYNLQQGFETFLHGLDLDKIDASKQAKHQVFFEREPGKTLTQRRSDLTAQDALTWLEERQGEDRPWCLWIHLFDVHDYTIVPPDDFAQEHDWSFPAQTTRAPKGMKSHELRQELYGPELTYMDSQLGRVLDWLRESGQYDDTLIVLVADHGQGLLDGLERHGWAKHRLLYEWAVHVPLIIKIPGEAPTTVVPGLVSTVDILPTILDALELQPDQPLDGHSLLGRIRGAASQQSYLAYADALNKIDHHAPPEGKLPAGQSDNLYCLSDGRWKLIWHHENPKEGQLYDLEADPEERTNLFSEDHPEVRRLLGQLEARDAFRLEPPTDEGGRSVSATALGGLGYGGGDEDADADSHDH